MKVRSLSETCARLFEERIEALNKLGEEDDAEDKTQILVNQRARFNLWAYDNGVFAEGNASLDARIKEHEDIIELVVGQLLLLQRHLTRLETFVGGRLEDPEVQDAVNIYDDSSLSSASSTSSVSSFTTADEATTPDGTDAAQAEQPSPLAGIINANHRLHRVGIAIRRAGNTSHNLKAAKEQFYDADGVNQVDVFRDWCLELLRYNFKTADPRTRERLAQANAERRRLFLYRKRHQAKLRGQREADHALKYGTSPAPKPFSASRTSSFTGLDTQLQNTPAARSRVQGSTAQLSQTTASKLQRNQFHYEASIQSTVFTAAPSTQRLFDSSMWPPAPKVLPGAAEFVCPYCSKVHPAGERSGKRWRNHFLRDLCPFVCLVEQCEEPHRLFPDQRSWQEHMESHNTKFACRQHPRIVYLESAEAFDQHILTEHRHFTQDHLMRLRSISDSRARLDISSCPMCGFVPLKAPVPGMSVANHDLAYKELLDHIAQELHFIAMWSLDEIEDLNESIPSDPSDLRSIDRSTVVSRDSLDDLDIGTEAAGEGVRGADDSYATPVEELDVPELIPDDVDPADQWAFVTRKRPAYLGPEFDTNLENLVRRYYLEKLLEEGKAADPLLPYYFMPKVPCADFYGREDALRTLESSLHPAKASKELRTMTLTGPAGIGKTALATKFCEYYQNQYDVILWVHADEDSKLANDFARIAIGLGFVAKESVESRDHDHCRQLVRAWLANPLKHREHSEDNEMASWLLVLDHVIDAAATDAYWPTDCKSGSILITSRRPMPWPPQHYPVLDVKPFNSEESAEFLFGLIKAKELDGKSITLGPRAVYTPNQLVFLAKTIASQKYSLGKFVQASQDDSGKKTILLLHTEDATKNQADFADWALESLAPQAGALLDMISMLDPDIISEELLTNPPDAVSVKEYPRTSEAYLSARAELLTFTFISLYRPARCITIHRVIQDAARKNMTKRRYRDVFNSCVALINDQWPYQEFTWRHGTDRWKECERLYPHIVRLEYFSKRIEVREQEIDADYGFARLATDVGWYCHERGRLIGADLCETALRLCQSLRKFLERNPKLSKVTTIAQVDRTIAEIYHNYGCICAEINRPAEALRHQLVCNQMMLEELGKAPGDDMRLSLSFNELGVAYMVNDDFATGQKCFQRSVDEMRRLTGFEEWKISLPLVNLGYCYYFDGRYEEAEEILLKGLADRVAKFGRDDQESFITGRFYNGLALVKLGQGLEDDSLVYLKRAQDHYKATVGRGHHRSADVAVAIGHHYNCNGDADTAVDYFNIALQAYGDRSIYTPEKARAYFRRAKAHRALGLRNESQADEVICLKLFRKVNTGDKRPVEDLTDYDFDRRIVFWSR